MNPQDLVIALFLALQKETIFQKDIATRLSLSRSGVSYSIQRLVKLRVISSDKKRVMVKSLLDFIKYAIHLVYPATPGSKVKGFPTAISAPPLNEYITSDDTYVWKSDKGTHIGQEIDPLYDGVINFALSEPMMYEVLSLIDAIRIGNSREKQKAYQLLSAILKPQ